jgi:amino acid transporter
MFEEIQPSLIEPIDLQQGAFKRTLTARGGVILALVIPMSGFTLIGYEIGALGAWGALAVWGGTSIIALLQNFIFAELAEMFPNASGGIAMYASKAWQRYVKPLGSILGIGYWAGWSLTLAVVSLVIGDLVQAEWFPRVTWAFEVFGNHVGLPTFIAAATVVLVYLMNITGLRVVINANLAIAITLAVLAGVCLIGPLVTGKFHGGLLTFAAGNGGWSTWKLLLTWGFVASWTSYGTEICAMFATEYKRRSDVTRALLSSSLIMLVVVAASTTVMTGTVGIGEIQRSPIGYLVAVVSKVLPYHLGGLVIAIICAAQLIALGSATSDSGRALYGMAEHGLTIRQLEKLNRHNQPARGMTVDMIFNLLVLFLVSNVAGIIFASNLGYLLAVFFALTGFMVLRYTHPEMARPLRLPWPWLFVAGALAIFNAVMIVVGFSNPGLVGYGGRTEQIISLSVIVLGLASYVWRQTFQEKAGFPMRDLSLLDGPEEVLGTAAAEPVLGAGVPVNGE